MLDHAALHLAFRARLRTLSVCTTGSLTGILSATATGYARVSGSFVADGFAAGQEAAPTGFTQTDVGVITAVAALTLTIAGGRTAQSPAGACSLAVGLPALCGWENVAVDPVAGRPFLEEELVPGGGRLLTQRSQGTAEQTGLYVVKWYGLAGYDLLAMSRQADAVLTLFPPGYGLSAGASDQVTVRTDVAPYRSQFLPAPQAGWVVSVITIPYRALSITPA